MIVGAQEEGEGRDERRKKRARKKKKVCVSFERVFFIGLAYEL